ncbi:MAG: plasmid pRiA4b ORF-3 family protein [Bacteroidia bacterium]|nr:plasmid pRiA4b ORF-3 family protein [Bacteroidia bacterium]
MAVYKFKVTFEEYDEVSRVIEIKSSQTFLDFHKAILDAIGFDQKQMASFYMSDDSWRKEQEISLEDMSDYEDDNSIPIPTMKDSRLSMFINDPHQKIVYVYDYMEMWTFHIELIGIEAKEKTGTKYPLCTKTIGIAPKQHSKVQNLGIIDESEFDELTKGILDKAGVGAISDDEADEHGLFEDENEEDDEMENFGFDEEQY